MRNSLDAVSDRDFALEALGRLHLGRPPVAAGGRDRGGVVLRPIRSIRLSDRFTTGSSIMPQKRNPDAAELVRAKTGRIAGAFQALLIVMKGLPLAYSKDMQEDKSLVFDALPALSLSLAAMTGMVHDMAPDVKRMWEAAGTGYATATDLADWLVREAGLPFREAHHVTGRIVAEAAARGVPLEEMPLGAAGRPLRHRRAGLRRAVDRRLGPQPHQRGRHRAPRTCAPRRARRERLAREGP